MPVRLAAPVFAALLLLGGAAPARGADAPAATSAEPPAAERVVEPAGATPPGSPAAESTFDEVSVTGERPGPGLWRVVDGDRTLYILGTVRPLPKKMVWRSREVEAIVARSQVVIPESPDVEADLGPIKAMKLYLQWRKVRRNADGDALEDVLPPELHARFEALRQAHAPRERGLSKLRPVLAAAALWNASLDHAGLTLRIGIDRQVRRLAKQAKVAIVEPTLKIDDPQGTLAELAQVPREAELACMAATLDRLESDLANARWLAEAWATGDVEAIRARKEWEHEGTCWSKLTTVPKLVELRRRFDEVWFDAAQLALATHETSLAVAPMPTLLKPDGILARFAAKGYEVLPP